MEYESIIQSVLEEIDERITEDIQADEFARRANYSTYHFRRVFIELTGTPFMNYITRRKLEHALYDLSQGKKIINVAMDYGFETHAGFTKAFKKHFGYPPSLYRLRIAATQPTKAILKNVKIKLGGIKMQVEIKVLTPFSVIGYASRHRMPGVKSIANLPGFYDTAMKDYAAELSTLFHTYTNFHHCEVILCLDVDEEHNCFTYMVSIGLGEMDYNIPQRPGTYRHEIPGGLYAVFTTPLAGDDAQLTAIQDTWKYVLEDWLPGSEYEYDDMRLDYEYHDERAHPDWRDDGKCCTEIRIPIRKRK
ncbi:MAG: AraC family transcriptional regulator [Defluviitaleaceae bacterium]|nr:AraC family transcriptional regulator [Defluviitaleaceae bacterium]